VIRTKKPTESVRVEAAGRTIALHLSAEAERHLRSRSVPLVAEAEILFSCLVRKQLTFRDASPDLLSWPVSDLLHVAVRPVRYEMCLPEGGGTEPDIVDFAVEDIAALIPKSFEIDYVDGEWSGYFALG